MEARRAEETPQQAGRAEETAGGGDWESPKSRRPPALSLHGFKYEIRDGELIESAPLDGLSAPASPRAQIRRQISWTPRPVRCTSI